MNGKTQTIKKLKQEVAKNHAPLDKATAICQKELAEENMLQAISALQSAVTVLSKHNSFLQLPIESKENKLQAKETVEDNVRYEKAEADMIAEANVAREADAEQLRVEMRKFMEDRLAQHN